MTIMHTYKVHLQRVNPLAGNTSNMTIQVQASDGVMARKTAESQYHGYRATGAVRSND